MSDKPSGMVAAAMQQEEPSIIEPQGEARAELAPEWRDQEAVNRAAEIQASPDSPAPTDALQAIFDDPRVSPDTIKLLAGRLGRTEHNTVSAIQLTQSVIQIGQNLDHLQKVVASLSSQQAMAEHQLEYQAKGLALDLAIKALKSDTAPISDPGAIVNLADAFLKYLRGSQG